MKMGDSSHLTPNFIGLFVISARVGHSSFKVRYYETMKELVSPIHAEWREVAYFGFLERFRTEEPVFGKDALLATDAGTDGLTVVVVQSSGTKYGTFAKAKNFEQASDSDSDDSDLTPVDVATQTSDSQGPDTKTGSTAVCSETWKGMDNVSEGRNCNHNKRYADHLCPIQNVLNAQIFKGQRFYLVKWGVTGKQLNV